MMEKTSHSINYSQISEQLLDDFDRVLEHFKMNLTAGSNRYYGSCPIHDGDNYGSFNLYYDTGNWKCYSKGCHEYFINTPFGFIRGILSKTKLNWKESGDDIVSLKETMQWCKDFLDCNIDDLKINKKEIEKSTFVKRIENIKYEIPKSLSKITKNIVREKLNIPSQYFLNRGFSEEVLQNFDIGDAIIPKTEMYGRAVAPIYDEKGEFMLACSGRSPYNKCGLCGLHHKFGGRCPTKKESINYVKWRHSKGYKKDNYLYNYWNVLNRGFNTLIIVESPINIWKLYESGYYNCVAILGSSFSDNQKFLLDKSGASKLILLTDMDAAGLEARKNITEKCKKLYSIKSINIPSNDIGDLSTEQVKELLR